MVEKEKTSTWREMKRKFGCINCKCQVKKCEIPRRLERGMKQIL